jgi:hypothetical protein
MASTTNEGQGQRNDNGGKSFGNKQGPGGGVHDPDHDHDNDKGHGHSDHDHDAPCYCRGTSILTKCGKVRIEDLAVGDMVVTISGEVKPIKWIGKRSYAGQFIASNRAVLPIVVCAGALAPDTPARDLWLSPRHALLIDGVLVPVELLINGQTILQAEAVEQVEYFHLEFEAHEVILAEGAPAESYVEYDNRQGFHNADEFATLYPEDTRASFGYCLPLLEPGTPELAAIRVRLFERAAAHGHLTTADPGLHRRRDRRDGASTAYGRHVFRIIAPIARLARAGSAPPISLMSWRGTMCHETPKRSFTQPHCSASGTAESASVRRRGGAAPHSLNLLLPRQLPSPGYSRIGGSSRQPVIAVGKRQYRAFCRRIGQLASDLPRLLGPIEPLQRFIQEQRHSVLPSVRKSSFLSVRETVHQSAIDAPSFNCRRMPARVLPELSHNVTA